MLKLISYKPGSRSVRALRNALGREALIFKRAFLPRDTYINWGNSNIAIPSNMKVLNKPEAIRTAVNKLSAFIKMKAAGISIPLFTTSHAEASTWLRGGSMVVCRHKLSASAGIGIAIVRPGEVLPTNVPLYTKYTKKDLEFRVHVFGGRVIDYAQKRARHSRDDSFDSLVRTHENGWIYSRDNISHLDVVKQEAIDAVAALGLDFGAADVIYRGGTAWVLEVNTAPGLEGTTVEKYVEALRSLPTTAPRRRAA